MVKELRKQFLVASRGDPPCGLSGRHSNAACARCGREPASQWRCLYEPLARTAWRLVKRPLTPSTHRPRGYYHRHLDARLDVVTGHMAHQLVRLEEQIAFLYACVRRPPAEQPWRPGGPLQVHDLDALDSATPAGRDAIREEFVSRLRGALRDALSDQPEDERRLGLPRENERYPWRRLRELAEDRSLAS